ncbi:hemerythrin [Geomonas limicola]|uniref:Hemerythrin n=1 Tax=Geomonas limicola TaxID=2740186 RepID=A0A6V8N4I0_9BACT|nr:hemerythrin family protein [Geomonas limicola]GFO67341.1 hemerythrin [Geomonas limicola]
MAILLWEKRFEQGIPEFDGHHRHLVELLNEVYRSAIEAAGPETLKRVTQELREYTEYHFSAEERAMVASGYPGLAEHREEHRKFEEMATAFWHELAAGGDISVDLLSFLGNWLFDHILMVDAEFCSTLPKGEQS